jgi:hypothetical protein
MLLALRGARGVKKQPRQNHHPATITTMKTTALPDRLFSITSISESQGKNMGPHPEGLHCPVPNDQQ